MRFKFDIFLNRLSKSNSLQEVVKTQLLKPLREPREQATYWANSPVGMPLSKGLGVFTTAHRAAAAVAATPVTGSPQAPAPGQRIPIGYKFRDGKVMGEYGPYYPWIRAKKEAALRPEVAHLAPWQRGFQPNNDAYNAIAFAIFLASLGFSGYAFWTLAYKDAIRDLMK